MGHFLVGVFGILLFGVDIKTLSSILGHFSAGFTLDTYAHVTTNMERDAAVKVEYSDRD